MISFFSILITVIFFGLIVWKYFKSLGKIEVVGISFLLGLGVETVVLFIMFATLNNVNHIIFYIFKIFELLSIVFLVKDFKVGKFLKPKVGLGWLFWGSILGLFTISLIYTLYNPVWTTDSLYYFDFRSKIMFLSGKVSEIALIPNWSYYPMYTSMIGLISRLLGMENSSFYYPLMFLTFALIFYSSLRRRMSSDLASLFTLLMYSTPLLYWQSRLDGMTNMPYAIFFSVGVLYCIQYVFSKDKKESVFFLIVSVICLGLSKWVRIQEPFWVVPLFIIIIASLKSGRFKLLIVGLMIFYLIQKVWPEYIRSTSLQMHGVDTTVSIESAYSKIGVITGGVANGVFDSFVKKFMEVLSYVSTVTFNSLNPVSSLFILSLLFLIFVEIDLVVYLTLFIVFATFGILVLSTFYSTFVWDWVIKLESSLSRMTSLFVPLMWYYLAILFVKLKDRYLKFNKVLKN